MFLWERSAAEDAAEDAAQDAWLDVWRGLSRFERGRPLRPWLLTVVANRCRMAARGRPPAGISSPLGSPEAEALVDPASHDSPPDGHWLDEDLAAALKALPVEQERVLALRFFADLELSEIATVTNVPLGTVKSRLHRALDTLRARLR